MFSRIPNVFVPLALVKVLSSTDSPGLCAGLFAFSVGGFAFFSNTPMVPLLTRSTLAFIGGIVFFRILKHFKDMPLFWPIAIAGSILLGYIG